MIRWLETNGASLSIILIILYLATLLGYFIFLMVLAVKNIDKTPKQRKQKTFLPFVLSLLLLIVIVAIAESIPKYISVIILAVTTLLQILFYITLSIKKIRGGRVNEK